MAQLKVIVNKLNIRTHPVLDFAGKSNVVGVLHQDSVFESVGEITNELGTWHVNRDGHWASEKWLGDSEALKVIQKSLQEIDYASFVSTLNFNWIRSAGINMTIGIIDTGIVSNNDYYTQFKEEVISSSNMSLSHGNFIGGIIAGKKNVVGLAKQGRLFSIKYKSSGDALSTELENFIAALTFISNLTEPIIVNVSQGFNFQHLSEKFPKQQEQIVTLIRQISSQNNKLIFCAADDNSAINDVLFPASMEECISIGCIDEFSTDLTINVKLNLLTPMVMFTSYDNLFNPTQDSGSSYSTAVISALAACFMSENGGISKKGFLDELEKASINRSSFNYGSIKAFQYQLIQK